MSEAVNPAMNPFHSLPGDSVQPSCHPTNEVEAAQSGGEEWEVVNFPGALDVAALGMEETKPAPKVTAGESEAEQPDRQAREQLQQENAELRNQLAFLAEELSQAQIELQLEMTRFYCKETEAEVREETHDRDGQAQKSAEAQIGQLIEAWQASHQFIEQQAEEITHLKQQLEHSQHRTAQLERDCVLSQQRYNEQVQLVAQVENTCQDLRMRLHRQQQQTLQFKAALEKSIEMNTVVAATLPEAITIAEPNQTNDSKDNHPLISKARPVQPWSDATKIASPLQGNSKSQSSGLPSLLAKLVRQPLPEPIPPAEPVPPVEPIISLESLEPDVTPVSEPQLDQASKNVLEFLFPAQGTAAIVDVPQPQAPVFDLSPFVEAGEIDSAQFAATTEPAETVVPEPEPKPTPPHKPPKKAGDGLWADLARLIEPNLTNEELSSLSASFTPETSSASEAKPAMPHPIPAVEADSKPIKLVAFPQFGTDVAPEVTNSEEATVAYHNPFPSFTLRSDEETKAESETDVAAAIAPSSSYSLDTTSDRLPSPILYPTRQPKKLASMAAVDLPSFPRR